MVSELIVSLQPDADYFADKAWTRERYLLIIAAGTFY
jgi:hypothetical protein